jgi:hypothetical protein
MPNESSPIDAARTTLDHFLTAINYARETGVIIEWSIGPGPDGKLVVTKFDVFKKVQHGH